MPPDNEIFEAVATIESPLFVGRTLGSLGLVKAAERTLTGKIKVDLLLPTSNPPSGLDDLLQKALAPHGRGADVTVEVMTEEGASAWIARRR